MIHGGAVADHIADGQAEIGIHQISEILPVKGVVLVGPLPADIQNFTGYSAGVGTAAKDGTTRARWSNFWPGRMRGRHQGQGHGAGVVRPQKASARTRRALVWTYVR